MQLFFPFTVRASGGPARSNLNERATGGSVNQVWEGNCQFCWDQRLCWSGGFDVAVLAELVQLGVDSESNG